MKIVVASCCCSREQNEKLFSLRKKAMIIPSQKFMDMVLRGMAAQNDVEIENVCVRAVSAKTSDIRKWNHESELSEDGKIRYEYIPFTNGKYSRFLTTMYHEYRYCMRIFRDAKRKKEDVILLTDITIWNAAIPARHAARKCGIPCVSLVTDLPQYSNAKKNASGRGIVRRFFQNYLRKELLSYDGYILLTEAMKDVVVQKNQPSVVTECMIDKEAIPADYFLEKQDKCVFLYAGGVYEKYGVKAFVEAFEKVADETMELQLFGDGDFVETLQNFPERYPHTVYQGCVSPLKIVDYEKKASVLVNPRPVSEEYTKYSFPSKTAEYMMTGRMILSTPLPGIPKEYQPYILWFDGDSEDDYIRGILRAKNMTFEEREQIGRAGKKFCLQHKTKEAQGEKMVVLLRTVLEQHAWKRRKREKNE